jgi:hypothetical protein
VLRDRLNELPPGPDKRVTRKDIEEEMSHQLDVSPVRAAQLVADIGASMHLFVSEGERDDLVRQLPRALKPLLGPSPSSRGTHEM